MPKKDCIGLMCHFASPQCRGFFSLTCIWSYLTLTGLSFLPFHCFGLCPERKANVSNSEPSGSSGGHLLGRKGVGSSAVMCDHGRAKGQCFCCVLDRKFSERTEARLYRVLSFHSGEMFEAVLCAFHKCNLFFSAVLG